MLGDTQATWRQVRMTVPIQDINLRDYFATAAMQGMFSEHFSSRKEEIAKAAYLMADAMLEARKNDPA